jgi:uncharacterized alpha-E superfamily protein
MTTTGMLSRIADGLFWIGRYVERADDTARILDSYLHRILEDPWSDEEGACAALLAILGIAVDSDEPVDTHLLCRRLAYDERNPSAIAGALSAARENARGAREVVSSEMWECLNVTWHALPAQRRAADRLGPHPYLRFVCERAALFFGLADSTMSQDDGWRFLVLGRSLERVDMTARLLSVRVLDASHAPDWTMLLRACGADESFLRTHGGTSDPKRIAEFLLLHRRFPRSVLHALATAEQCLIELGPDPGPAGVPDPARRPIGQMRTRLEYADRDRLLDELPGQLRDLQRACLVSSQAIAARFFQYAPPVAWEVESSV